MRKSPRRSTVWSHEISTYMTELERLGPRGSCFLSATVVGILMLKYAFVS